MKKVAIFGFVHADEVIARWLKKSSENVVIYGYLLAPNAAFESVCDRVVILEGEILTNIAKSIVRENFDIVYLGPIPSILVCSNYLIEGGVDFLGPTISQLEYELDKSKIYEVFSSDTSILPTAKSLTSFNESEIFKTIDEFNRSYVLKFVGDYRKYYPESEVGRVRLSDETISESEILDFIRNSIESSGKAILQEKISGFDFSANYLVDAKENLFSMGENVCYKRKFDNDAGPMTDGTGAYSVAGSVPFIDHEDQEAIRNIVKKFVTYVNKKTGRKFKGLLNLDLIKSYEGNLKLCEINCREAGAHTLASLYNCLKNDLYVLLKHTFDGTLDQIQPEFNAVASVVVSAYPTYFPKDVSREEFIQVRVSKKIPNGINLFTGWVELLNDSEDFRELLLMSSPSLIFECYSDTLLNARELVYQAIETIVPKKLIYRKDIGIINK
jgi:phosphoribosylamine-glycine ligase